MRTSFPPLLKKNKILYQRVVFEQVICTGVPVTALHTKQFI